MKKLSILTLVALCLTGCWTSIRTVAPVAEYVAPVKTVYSTENLQFRPQDSAHLFEAQDRDAKARPTVGSVPFVPPVMGFIMAGEIIKDLIHG